MKTTTIEKTTAVINLVAFLGMLTVNILATSLPLNGLTTGELSDALPNLFVPIGLTFSIWGVIWVLLGAYLVLQLRTAFGSRGTTAAEPERPSPYSPRVAGPWFAVNMVLNSAWIFFWHFQMIGISVVIMLGLLFSLIVMFLRTERAIGFDAPENRSFALVPISVYFGWITIATVANITAFLVSVGWDGFGIPEVGWTVFVIAVALGLTVAMLLRHRNFAFAAVAVWSFIGIAAKRGTLGTPEGPAVLIAAAVAAGIVLALGGVMLAKKPPLTA
ncbi:MAG: tryptophan-rich sensory protein [Spirochaetaceae bacterium]|nr:MAG: tryptophan-rich sensory protein [Spirochaetaceae bacterium]